MKNTNSPRNVLGSCVRATCVVAACCASWMTAPVAGNGADGMRMLFFTSQHCPPCRQTEPNIDRMIREGYPVEKVDVSRRSPLAAQFNVRRTPTTIIIRNGREVSRHAGPLTYAHLRQLWQAANGPSPGSGIPPNSSSSHLTVTSTPNRNAVNRTSTSTRRETTELTPEQLAYFATVRLRIDDNSGTSFATGTIVHRKGQEALVLTCGHVFRDSRGQGTIQTDLGFAQGQPQTVTGRLLYYDADAHDVALVLIPCPLPIAPVSIAPPQMVMQTGDRVFSLGCDHGKSPSIRQTALKAVTRYGGVAKFDTVGRPVDGRSGGGLFTLGGQLVGVCNAAAVDVDEGIYTGLESIYWQFGQTKLTHLFQPKTNGAPSSQLVEDQPDPVASQNRLAALDRAELNTRPPASTQNFNPTVNRDVAVRIPDAGASPVGSDLEVIILLRSKSNPQQIETITVSEPTADFLRLARQGQLRASNALVERAQMPPLPATARAGAGNMRAQSPR